MPDNTVALAALALTTTIAAGFFALINKQNSIHEKLVDSMNKMSKSSERVADETKQGNKEAKERNGHLAELIIQNGDKTIDAIQNIPVQHIEVQKIDTQITK